MWDLGIPQEAATILYEDNDGATAMANAGKPTSRTRHIDIKFYAIQEWVERHSNKLGRPLYKTTTTDTLPSPQRLHHGKSSSNLFTEIFGLLAYLLCTYTEHKTERIHSTSR
jgi:hypothetical protein